MSQLCHFDARRSLIALEQDSTIIAVIELSQSKWLVAGLVPGVEREPLKKLDAREEALLKLLQRWRHEARPGWARGYPLDWNHLSSRPYRNCWRKRVAYEAGRDGFLLARWLRAHDVEAYALGVVQGRAQTDLRDSVGVGEPL